MAEPPEPGLGQKAVRGAAVTLTGQAGRILVQVLSVVILARLLDPADYGLLAMVVAVVGVGEVVRDFGLSSAAIQASTLTREQRSNLFWINTAIGALLAGIVVVSAPVLAHVYDEDRLVDLARVLAMTFLLNGAATQYRADLNRRMQFSRLAVADVVAPAGALTAAVVAGLLGVGYWALAVQQLTQAGLLLVLVACAGRWLPGRPRRDVPMRHLLTFGGNLVGTQLIGYVANNVDSVVIGTRFGAEPLGLYNRAFQLLMTPLNQIRSPTTTVALPVLARLQDDPVRFNRFVERGQIAVGYTIVPALAVVAGAAEPVTAVFLGASWNEVAPILALLACAGIFQTLAYVGYWVYLAQALTRDLLHYTLISVTVKITCVVVGSTWGVVGVASGYALAPLLTWPLSLWWLSRAAGLDARPLYAGAVRIVGVGVVVAAASAGSVTAAAGLPALVQVVLAVLAATLAGSMTLVHPAVRRDVRDLRTVGRHLVGRRRTSRRHGAESRR